MKVWKATATALAALVVASAPALAASPALVTSPMPEKAWVLAGMILALVAMVGVVVQAWRVLHRSAIAPLARAEARTDQD